MTDYYNIVVVASIYYKMLYSSRYTFMIKVRISVSADRCPRFDDNEKESIKATDVRGWRAPVRGCCTSSNTLKSIRINLFAGNRNILYGKMSMTGWMFPVGIVCIADPFGHHCDCQQLSVRTSLSRLLPVVPECSSIIRFSADYHLSFA